MVISQVIRDTGEELPVKEIGEFVRRKKREINPDDPDIFIMIDGAQALGNLPRVDFKSLGCDAYVATPHKIMSSTPVGIGFFNPDNQLIRKNLPKLNKLFWQDQQVILDGMFDSSLGIKPNVADSLDRMDIYGFKRGLDRLREVGYEDGNFEKINLKRRELKEYFRGIIHKIAGEFNLPISEVERGTDFIYSFSLSGINNREFTKVLSEQGIFVSYIDRAKLQKDDVERVGNGVIRVSFSIDNSKQEIDEFKEKIRSALVQVTEKEFVVFEARAEQEMVFKRPDNVVYLSEWLKKKAKSPVTKVAAAAAALIMALSYQLFTHKAEISLDQKFAQAKLEELDYYQKRYAKYQGLSERIGFRYRVAEETVRSRYFFEKYKFLTNLSDEKQINKLLSDDVSGDLIASFDYSAEERKEIKSVYEQTKNKKLGRLLKTLANNPREKSENIV